MNTDHIQQALSLAARIDAGETLPPSDDLDLERALEAVAQLRTKLLNARPRFVDVDDELQQIAAKISTDISARGIPCSQDDVILANNISQFVRDFIDGNAQLGTKATRDFAAQDTEGARGSAIMLAQLCGRLYEGGYGTLNQVAIDVMHIVTGVLAHYTSKPKRPKHLHGG